MISAFNIANTYMLVVDGWGYAYRGVAGSYVVDAFASFAAIILLAAALLWISRRRPALALAAASLCDVRCETRSVPRRVR